MNESELKQKISPIYSELQGYLSQSPDLEKGDESIYDDMTLAHQVNAAIEELAGITRNNYDRFKIEIRTIPWNRGSRRLIEVAVYRAKLGGLIARLHREYFSDEAAPFGGMPSTVINTTQTQSQTVQVQILLEFQTLLDKALSEVKKNSKEESFLQKIKNSLVSVKGVSDLITLLLTTAKDVGLSVEQILKLLF